MSEIHCMAKVLELEQLLSEAKREIENQKERIDHWYTVANNSQNEVVILRGQLTRSEQQRKEIAEMYHKHTKTCTCFRP